MMKKKHRIAHVLHRPGALLHILFVLAGVGLFFVGAILLIVAFTPVPSFDEIANRKINNSTKIYDRTGETVLYDMNPDVKRNTVPLADIAPYIQQAAIAVEDDTFYQNSGVSPLSFLRAVVANIFAGGYSQGGSTITQQVVKLTLLTNEKSIPRKIHEWILAIKLTEHYTKDQILELYLNNTPYGGVIYGAETASRAFFGKSAKDVDLAEAAYLAALPQSPTYLSPYGNNRQALENRKNFVLSRMMKTGKITQEQYNQATAEKVAFNPQPQSSIIAPHFVFYIRQYLEQKYGTTLVDQGLAVITTLDTTLEHQAEAAVNQYALSNEKQFNASNAAAVAIDPKTGQILAMVGSRNYFDTAIDGSYNIATAQRQPGSSFKPFVYAAALEKGYTPGTALFDLPTQFSTSCSPSDIENDTPPCYAPSNYDDKFRGPMTFTTALAQSINVPAVKTLYLAGVRNVIDLATRFGFDLGDPKQYGLSLALGAADVRLLDLVSAYAAFAADGVLNPPTGILKVTDAQGNVLEEYTPAPKTVIDSGVARDISSMLSNNAARYPEYDAVNPLAIPGFDVAAKTGTTNDFRDTWTIGYTPTVALGVWAGNNDNSSINKKVAGYVAAPLWRAIMDVAVATYPKEYFGEPRSVSDAAPAVLKGIYQQNGQTHDLLYWVNKDNPLIPGSGVNDPQNAYWEYSVRNWSGSVGGQ